MSESYRALCTDFYVNQKLQTKLPLPTGREHLMDFFERVRKQFPTMRGFRKTRDEFALESSQTEMPHHWMALRGSTIRTGVVNAPTLHGCYPLHKLVLESAPSYLSISPLDVECLELLFGFDLLATGNHDAIVLEALGAGSPLAHLLDGLHDVAPSDFQPILGFTSSKHKDIEIYFEVKTRPAHGKPRPETYGHEPHAEGGEAGEPISVYVTLRKFGPVQDMKELPAAFAKLSKMGEELVEHRVVPGLLVPIREAIASGNA